MRASTVTREQTALEATKLENTTRAQRNARTLQPAALAFVPYGFVLVRVRVRYGKAAKIITT
jgi:hypothetical protein